MSERREFVERASDAAFSIDSLAQITGWNSRLTKLTGYSEQEVLGKFCGKVLQATLPGGAPLCASNCCGYGCLLSGKAFSVSKCFLRTRDGRVIEAEFGTLALTGTEEVGDSTDGDQPKNIAVVFVREKSGSEAVDGAGQLQVFGFSDFGLVADGRPLAIEEWQRKKSVTLLKILVVNRGRLMHRERLASMLWPEADEDKGWERLRVTIYALRKELRAAGITETVIDTIDKSYRLNSDLVWFDFDAFEVSIEAGLAFEKGGHMDDALLCFENALKLYRGDFLADEIYSDWCAEKREQLRELYLEMLASLVRCYEQKDQRAQAAQSCRAALACDPCRESFLRSLIKNLVKIGRSDRAKVEYLYWQKVYSDQLGVEPMLETRQLYHNIVVDIDDEDRVVAASN